MYNQASVATDRPLKRRSSQGKCQNTSLVVSNCRSRVLSLLVLQHYRKIVTMAVASFLFFLIITVGQECGRKGDDGPNPAIGVADVLNTGVPGVTTLHAVKVSGESEFYAFVQVQNISALDALSIRFCEIGNVVVKSRPLIDGGVYGRLLGVSENLTVSNSTLGNEGLYFQEYTVFPGGKTAEEILDLNRQQIELLFNLRQRGELSIVLYKAFETNTFLILVNIADVAEYDLQANFFPFKLVHGTFVNTFSKGVQLVSQYALAEEAEY